jgi:hypothetical protein
LIDVFTEIEAVLDVFRDSYMNKHLIFAIVECLLGVLVPEMQELGSCLGSGWDDY